MITATTSHASHTGHTRRHMEDDLFIPLTAESARDKAHLYAVFDGMGGHSSGRATTRFMVDFLTRHLDLADVVKDATLSPSRLLSSMNNAYIDLEERDGPRGHDGRSAACAMIRLVPRGALISHSGNCRVYRVRDRRVTLLTHDHSLMNDHKGQFDATEMAHYGHLLTRALGSRREEPLATHQLHAMRQGDRFILCTDGLWREFEAAHLEQLMCEACAHAQPAQRLLEAVLAGRASDNVAIVVVEITRYEGVTMAARPELDFGSWRSLLHQLPSSRWAEIVDTCDTHQLSDAQLRYAADLLDNTEHTVRPTPTHWLWDVALGLEPRPELLLCNRFAPDEGTRFEVEEFRTLLAHPHLAHITEFVCGHDTLRPEILHIIATHPAAARLTRLSWPTHGHRDPFTIKALLDSPVLSREILDALSPLTPEERERLASRA